MPSFLSSRVQQLILRAVSSTPRAPFRLPFTLARGPRWIPSQRAALRLRHRLDLKETAAIFCACPAVFS